MGRKQRVCSLSLHPFLVGCFPQERVELLLYCCIVRRGILHVWLGWVLGWVGLGWVDALNTK